MRPVRFPILISVTAAVGLLLLSVIGGSLAQNKQPNTTPSPQVSPTASPTPSPTPARAPSPTPLPIAQNYHQWGSITVFNGLPSDSVRAIAQTEDGVMWFGTDNGLARFDGRRVQNFTPGGPDSNHILSLNTMADGRLLIGTAAGAFVYVDDRFQQVAGTQDTGVTFIFILSDISVYLGTDTGLVLSLDTKPIVPVAEQMFAEPLRADDGSPLGISSLLEQDGKLLASTHGRGVFLIEHGTAKEHPASPRPIFVNSLIDDKYGTLWLATDAARSASGVYLQTGPRVTRVAAPTADVLALDANKSGLWAGSERFGLFHFDRQKLKKNYTFENTSGGLRSDNIFTLFTDRESVLWVGTNRGVSRFDQIGAFQQAVSSIANSNFVRTLYQAPGDAGRLFAGTNRGLFYFDTGDRWTEIPALKGKVVYSVGLRGDAVVVGTADGLYSIDGRRIIDGDIRGLAELNGRSYAAVYGKGLADITDEKPRLVFTDASPTSVAEDRDKVWIGTEGRGLFSFDGDSIKTEAGPDVLKSGTIWSIYKAASDDTVYIAGEHGVFAFLDGKVEQVAAAEDVRDVFERDGHIWAASTTQGLLHARRDERFGWLISAVGFEQGMPSEKTFSILPSGDALKIATNRGIVTYTQGTVEPKLIATRVLSQRVHDLSELRSKIEIDYPQNSILIEVAGQSSRTFPEEFQYAFVLKNAGGDVIDSRLSREPQFAPSNLKPGDYTIESIAFDRDLLSSEPLVISFSIAHAPFPWTAAALAVLLIIAVVALVWAVIERRRIAQSSIELAAARFDLANEAERERRRIARDLHDQTLADLRNLMMKGDKLGTGGDFRNEIEAVSTEIRRICEDLSPSVLENVGLVAALEFLLTQTVENPTFSASDGVEDRIGFPLNVQLQIYRIAQEALTNIARHSTADRVEMKVAVDESGNFEMTIRDNGDTFDPESATHRGRGISNIRSRANLINGTAGWSRLPSGENGFALRVESTSKLTANDHQV